MVVLLVVVVVAAGPSLAARPKNSLEMEAKDSGRLDSAVECHQRTPKQDANGIWKGLMPIAHIFASAAGTSVNSEASHEGLENNSVHTARSRRLFVL